MSEQVDGPRPNYEDITFDDDPLLYLVRREENGEYFGDDATIRVGLFLMMAQNIVKADLNVHDFLNRNYPGTEMTTLEALTDDEICDDILRRTAELIILRRVKHNYDAQA